MEAIKYCPFCGKEAKVIYNNKPSDNVTYGVTCMNCTARVFGYSLPEPAIKAWNRRVDAKN